MSPLKYLQSVTNYLEILLIILSLLTCDVFKIELNEQRNVAVACILLLAYKLFLLVGSLPVSFLSTHMLMLEAVCKSFLLYSIFILTFALCFYMKSCNSDQQITDEVAFHIFANPLVAFSKTIVMFTGEFDAGTLQLDSNYAYLLFLSFVFFMTIILFNLLNGLAVSDTQAIKDQAELNDIICRTNLLYQYEKAVFHQATTFSFILKRQPFVVLCQMLQKLFPDYTTDVQISILPNDNNRILDSKINKKISTLKMKDLERSALESLSESDSGDDVYAKYKCINCWISWLTKRCTRIDKRSVTNAVAILQKKSSPSMESRLEGMEEKLNEILKSLNIKNIKKKF